MDELDKALAVVSDAVGMPDDMPVDGCKEPEYAGGRNRVLKAIVSDGLVTSELAELWRMNYCG